MKIDIFRIYIISSLLIGCFSINSIAYAQIDSDKSLPIPTEITQTGNYFKITKGTEAGSNLFHSFNNFSVPSGGIAEFINDNVSVKNVISRVSGNYDSKILGIVKAGGTAPNFNLFFINPNGFFFGSQASLDLKGSFLATTANSIQFGDRGIFETANLNNDPSLLKINPTAFFFDQIRPQPITYESSLALPSNKSFLLLGGDLIVDRGRLNVPNGRIELGSLAEQGMVNLNFDKDILSLGVPDDLDRGDIFLTNGSIFTVQSKSSGSVALNARNIKLSGGSSLRAGIGVGLTSDTTNPGGITLNASKDVTFEGINSGILNVAEPSSIGNPGQIFVKSDSLNIIGFSGILTYSLGQGNPGSIALDVSNGITLSRSNYPRPAFITSAVGSNGDGISGDITIQAGSLSLSEGSVIRSNILGKGNAGNIVVRVDDFVKIFDSKEFPSEIRAVVEPGAIGNAGNINVYARALFLSGGGRLTAAVLGPQGRIPGGQGKGGNISVIASDSVTISGTSASNFKSGIFSNADLGTKGGAGNVNITTNFLKIDDGAEIKLSNPQGSAGNLVVNASQLILNKGKITSETGGNELSIGANIDLNLSNFLSIENDSLISAKARNIANGGNININTQILLAFPPTGLNGSDIIANAEFGKGGNISINSQGIFGIEERRTIDGNQTNDIDASSQFGQSGQVQINTTTDPNQGLVELPATVIDPSTLVAQNPCKRASSSEFTRSGRGGLPPSLSQDLNGGSTQVSLVEPVNFSAEKPESKSDFNQASAIAQSSSQIAPAQGWVYNSKGEVVLVAYNSAVTDSQRIQTTPAGCPVF